MKIDVPLAEQTTSILRNLRFLTVSSISIQIQYVIKINSKNKKKAGVQFTNRIDFWEESGHEGQAMGQVLLTFTSYFIQK